MSIDAVSTQSIKDLLNSPIRGQEWQSRFLIGVGMILLGFIPIIPWIFQMGYFSRIMQRAIRGDELELPAWADWGKLGRDGLRLFGVSTIYLLPGYIVMFGGMAVYFIGFFLLVPLMATAEQSSEALTAMPVLMFILMGVMFLSMFLGNLLIILGAVPLPVALARAVEQDKFTAAFHFAEISKLLWRNKAGYFVAWVILAGLLAIFYSVTVLFYMTMIFAWVLFILLIPFSFYLLAISAALFGQTYRESLETVV
jgi:hypothetical protein